MKRKIYIIGLLVAACLISCKFFYGCKAHTQTQKPVYLDTKYSFEERAADLVSRVKVEEKQSLLRNTMAAIPRLGVNSYYVWGEALHGVAPTNVQPQRRSRNIFPQQRITRVIMGSFSYGKRGLHDC